MTDSTSAVSVFSPSANSPLNIVVDFRVYSATGRGYPDVAARGNNYQVVVGGKTYHIGGTSASAPVRDPRDKFVLCVQLTPSVPL